MFLGAVNSFSFARIDQKINSRLSSAQPTNPMVRLGELGGLPLGDMFSRSTFRSNGGRGKDLGLMLCFDSEKCFQS